MSTATPTKTSRIAPQFGLETGERKDVSRILQDSLSDLIALGMQLKQAHWNLVGPQFRAVHVQLDEIHLAVRGHADAVAERITTLGLAADGRPENVARNFRLEAMPGGRLPVRSAIAALSSALAQAVRQGRETLPKLGEKDPISEDLMIGVLGDLEKHEWMLRAQIEGQ